MIELVCARVIQVLALKINLAVTELAAEVFAVIYGRGTSLKLFANAAEFVNKLRRVADSHISLRDFFHSRDELRGKIRASEFAEETFLRRIFFKIR